MSKNKYLNILEDLLREHYGILKETGSVSRERKNFIDGYLAGARALNAIYQKELTDFIENIHFEVFGMTIEDRKKKETRPDISEADLEIPAYKRQGVRLKF